LLVLLPLLLLLQAARAAEAPGHVAQVADEVEAAIRAKDGGALKRLAAGEDPDPWLVADLLEARGHEDVARAFAEAASRAAVDKLPAYLARAEKDDATAKARALLAKTGGLPRDDVIAALAKGMPTTPCVPAVRLHRVRGLALHAAGRYAKAATTFGQGADLAEAAGWLGGCADLLYQQARAWEAGQDFAAAATTQKRRLGLEKQLGSEMGMGRAHFGLGVAYAWQRKLGKARTHLAEAARLAEASKDGEYVAKGLAMQALTLKTKHDFEGAIKVSADAAAALALVDGKGLPARFQPDPARMATSRVQALMSCASLAYLNEDRKAGRGYARQAREIAKSSSDPRLQIRARALRAHFEGIRLARAGEDLQALAELETSRDLHARLRATVFEADARRRLAEIQLRIGDTTHALENLKGARKALEATGARLPLAHVYVELARSVLLQGRLMDCKRYLDLGDALAAAVEDESLDVELEVLRAKWQAVGGHAGRAIEGLLLALGEPGFGDDAKAMLETALAKAQAHTGALQDALAATDRAISLLADSEATAHQRSARLLRGNVLIKLARYDEGYGALDALRAEAGERGQMALLAETTARLGDIRFLQGRFEDAKTLHRRAMGAYRQQRKESAAVHLQVQLGRDRFFDGDQEDGIDEIERAYEASKDLLDPRLSAWGEMALAETYLKAGRYAESAAKAMRGVETAAGLGLDLASGEASVAGETFAPLTSIGLEACYRAKDWDGVYAFVESGRSQKLLAALGGRRALREASIPKALRDAEDAARSAEALAYARYQDARRKRKTLDQIRALKGAVEEAQTRLRKAVTSIQRKARMQTDLAYRRPVKLAALQKTLNDDEAVVLYDTVAHQRAIALVVTKTKTHIRTLGTADEVSQAVAALLGDRDMPVHKGAIQRASDLVVGKLKLAKGVRRVLVSPDATLAFVPFPLLDRSRSMVHVPSASVFGVLRTEMGEAGAKVLAMGDPDYRATGSVTAGPDGQRTRGARGGQLPQLDATKAEVNAIANKKRGDTILTGKAASETNFWESLHNESRWHAIHFACHGLVDPEDATLCSVELTADDENDGSIWALDIFRREIQTDLVVLSGCETGKGRVRRGEGLIGLARAFMQAGVPRVIASLWEVDDDATGALMTKFYELWRPKDGSKGEPTALALRHAQAFIRQQKKWSHPRYWAAWMLWGLPD